MICSFLSAHICMYSLCEMYALATQQHRIEWDGDCSVHFITMTLRYRDGTRPPVGTEPLSVISAVIWNNARHPVPAVNTVSSLHISTLC